MKILYFYQYFTTPKGSYGTRVYEFTREWVKSGHEVTVITSEYYKSDIRAKKFIDDQVIDGVKLKVLKIRIDNKQSMLKRIWGFVQYSVISSYYAITLPADIVIASSGPLTVGIPGLLARYIRKRRLIFEVRDLWPQGAIELGLIRNKLMKAAAFWMEKRCYLASSHIITLSPGMSANISHRFKLKNITSVTNSANIELFIPGTDQQLKDKWGHYAIYTGNIGDVNNSMWLVDAARELKRRGVTFVNIVIIGDGQQRGEIERLVVEEELKNLHVMGLMSKHEVVKYVQNALVSVVPLKAAPILDTSSPNKFFESLSAGVPVIQNTQGWMKDFLTQHQVGYTVSAEHSDQFVETLITLANDKAAVASMGIRARAIAETEFDKRILAAKMLAAMKN